MQSIFPRGHRFVSGSVLVALLALLAALLPARPVHAQQPGGIHVTGVGEVQVVPDLARISLEVRREGVDAAALKTELDTVTRAVLALTRELDVDERDVTAAAISIYPRYRQRDGESVVDGVVASRAITITLRELDHVGDLVNGALSRGINGVNGIELDASDRAALEREALDRAIDDAVRQAGQIAARFRVGLGPLVNAGSALGPQPGPMMMDVMAASAPAARESFAPGEMTVRREISASFAIAPTQ